MAPDQSEKSVEPVPPCEQRVEITHRRDGTTGIAVHNGGPLVISTIVRGTDHQLRIPLGKNQASDPYDIADGVGG